MKPSRFFNRRDKIKILETIQEAELKTSGEIRVHIENHCTKQIMERAEEVFYELQMDQTELKNGVLIYLAISDKKFAILGDQGIDEVVPDDFWNTVRDGMSDYFKKGEFSQGLVYAIGETGKKLSTFFPYQSNDINELSDEISFYDN